MNVACAKGCGFPVPVSAEALKEMVDLGTDIVVSHDVCPNDPAAPQRIFRIVTEVYEVIPQDNMDDDVHEKLASMGDIVHGANFTMAVEELGKRLTAQWAQIVGLSSTIDEDGTSGQDRDSYTDDQDRESYTEEGKDGE